MASSTVSGLTAASPLVGTELFYGDDGVTDVKVTTAQIGNYMAGHVLDAGTLTASSPMVVQQVWNNGAVTFTGFRIDITGTAYNAASKLIDVRITNAAGGQQTV